nr:hypothetical protein [Tanacetum cinerariifolium]
MLWQKEKSKEEQEAPEAKAYENLDTEADIWKLYTDRASNEHGSGACLILIDLEGLRIAAKMKVEKNTRICRFKVCSKPGGRIIQSKREDNKKADALSKLAAVQCEGLTKGVLIEELNERSVDTAEVNAIVKETTRTWMTPIQEYIEHGILPEDFVAQTIRKKHATIP